MIRRTWAKLLDVVLGPRCQECVTRVFTRDQVDHYRVCSRRSL